MRVQRLTGGIRPRNDENSIEPILNRIPTDGYSYLDFRYSFLICAEDPFDEEIEYMYMYICLEIRNVSGIRSSAYTPRIEAIQFYSTRCILR